MGNHPRRALWSVFSGASAARKRAIAREPRERGCSPAPERLFPRQIAAEAGEPAGDVQVIGRNVLLSAELPEPIAEQPQIPVAVRPRQIGPGGIILDVARRKLGQAGGGEGWPPPDNGGNSGDARIRL